MPGAPMTEGGIKGKRGGGGDRRGGRSRAICSLVIACRASPPRPTVPHSAPASAKAGWPRSSRPDSLASSGFARRVAIKRMLGDAAADDPRRAPLPRRGADRDAGSTTPDIVAVTDVGLSTGCRSRCSSWWTGINAQQLLQRAGGALPLEVALAIVRRGRARARSRARARRRRRGARRRPPRREALEHPRVRGPVT